MIKLISYAWSRFIEGTIWGGPLSLEETPKQVEQLEVKVDPILEYRDYVMAHMSPESVKDLHSMLGLGGLGLAGEAGEVADIAKKVIYHGMPFDDKVKKKLLLELGDTLFYLVFDAYALLGLTLYDVIEANREKLDERFKSGTFSVEEFMEKENKKAE